MNCLTIGDSIAVGVSRVAQHDKYLKCGVLAHVGDTTKQVLEKYADADVDGVLPLTVISVGSNDDKNKTHLTEYITLRNKFHGKVIWIMPANNHLAEDEIKLVSREFQDKIIYFIPGPDKIHPTALGYRFLVTQIN